MIELTLIEALTILMSGAMIGALLTGWFNVPQDEQEDNER